MTALKSLMKRGYDDFRIRNLFEDYEIPLMNDFMNNNFNGSRFVPKVDILEDKDNVYVNAEIPGVKKDHIKVTLSEDMITISGEKKKEIKEEDQNFYRIERTEGSFTRSFTLPKGVKTDKIYAEFNDGILQVTLPKMEDVKKKEKEIEIK